jgi:hypothetical protein
MREIEPIDVKGFEDIEARYEHDWLAFGGKK